MRTAQLTKKERAVVLVSPNKYPNGDAGAIRDDMFAKIYSAIGYKPFILCENRMQSHGMHNNITYISLQTYCGNLLEKLFRFFTYTQRLKAIIQNKIESNYEIVVVHLYDAPEFGIRWLKRYTKRRRIQIIHDSVEWYSASEFSLGYFDKSYIMKNRLNKTLITQPIKVIAISTYLESYFCSKGLTTIRIPVIMDKTQFTPIKEMRNDYRIRLVYAGSPAKKDDLSNVLKAFEDLSDDMRKRFELHIIGIEKTLILNKLSCSLEQLSNIFIYGWLSREKTIELLKTMDFSILFRPAGERYAKAGYPTKSVEAMMNGVAMFCNMSSDLQMYLKHRENAFILSDNSIGSITEGLKKLGEINDNEIAKIKKEARKTAERYFDYKMYIPNVQKLIETN